MNLMYFQHQKIELLSNFHTYRQTDANLVYLQSLFRPGELYLIKKWA